MPQDSLIGEKTLGCCGNMPGRQERTGFGTRIRHIAGGLSAGSGAMYLADA
jgi:hypothetical protein